MELSQNNTEQFFEENTPGTLFGACLAKINTDADMQQLFKQI